MYVPQRCRLYTFMFNFSKKDKKEPESIKELLESFKKLENNFESISEELREIKNKMRLSVQKVGIIRFNPFKEVGSNQSFSIALLNEENDGFVITSLYERERCRVYGKPIKSGQSEYSLSEDEKKAVEEAKSSFAQKIKFQRE